MGANDPERELHGADRFDWERAVKRCRIGPDLKLTALILATWADQRGRNVRPGVPRLAAVLECSEITARRRLDRLTRLGLIERVSRGGGPRKRAATYRLTLPSDLLDMLPMLAPDERTPLIDRDRSKRTTTQLTLGGAEFSGEGVDDEAVTG